MINQTSALKTPSVLFLYGVPGSGHQRAAQALRNALETSKADWRLQEAALSDPPRNGFATAVNKTYLSVLQTAPGAWDLVYDKPWLRVFDFPFRQGARFMGQNLFKKLRSFENGVIVATQATAANAAAEAKRLKLFKGPLVGVLTDFTVHRYWARKEIDFFIVPTNQCKEKLASDGVPENKIHVIGIPIQDPQTFNWESSHQPFSTDPSRPLVLVMGGTKGLFSPKKLLDAVAGLQEKTEVVFLCGSNEAAFQFLSRIEFIGNARLRALKTPFAGAWMKKADLLISKPGGLTAAEALASHVPWIIWNPLPGPEKENAKFLHDAGAARWAQNEFDLKSLIPFVLRDHDERRRLQTAMRTWAKPHAASQTARFIAGLGERQNVSA